MSGKSYRLKDTAKQQPTQAKACGEEKEEV